MRDHVLKKVLLTTPKIIRNQQRYLFFGQYLILRLTTSYLNAKPKVRRKTNSTVAAAAAPNNTESPAQVKRAGLVGDDRMLTNATLTWGLVAKRSRSTGRRVRARSFVSATT